MEKIEFINNVTKANADTFNTLQDNIEEAITNITPVLLWTNPNPGQSRGNFSVNVDLTDYEYFDIYTLNSTTGYYVSCSKCLKGYSTTLYALSGGSITYTVRNVAITDSGFSFGRSSTPGVAYDDNNVIPLKIIGYKSI